MKKSREKCVFVLVPQQCVTQSVTCSASCPPARLCSLTVISVDQSTEGGSEEKKMEGRRAASQSRSSSRNPTGWKYVVGIRSRMLSSPDSSSLLSVRPSSRLLTDLLLCAFDRTDHALWCYQRWILDLDKSCQVKEIIWIWIEVATWPWSTRSYELFV